MRERILNQIADLLTPLLATEDQRRALLQRCCADLAGQIDFDGSAADFATRLVGQLAAHGEVEPGRPALVALLEIARARVGLDQQERIDALTEAVQRDRGAVPGRRVYTDARDTDPRIDPAEVALLVAEIEAMDANGGYDTEKVLRLKRQYPHYQFAIDTAMLTRIADRQRRIVDELQMAQAQVVQLSINMDALRQNQEAFAAVQTHCGVRRDLEAFRLYFRSVLVVVLVLAVAFGLHLAVGL